MENGCVYKIIANVTDFKAFWKCQGPFRYALTSAEYPPVLLEPEAWVFGSDATAVLKALMGFSREKNGLCEGAF